MARAHLYGTPVSPGLALGTLHFLHADRIPDRRHIPSGEIAEEQARLGEAAERVRADLARARDKVPADLEEYRDVIDAQIEMTRDPKLVEAASKRIARERVNAAWALTWTVDQICEVFRNMDDPYLRDRAQDIRVVGLRICDYLSGAEKAVATDEAVILAAEDISPADIMDLDFSRVHGIATREGGGTSHTAILARGLHIPALVGVTGLLQTAREGDRAILDGLGGNVLLSPNENDLADFTARRNDYQAWTRSTGAAAPWPADTKDGLRVGVLANVERAEEARELMEYGADGVGLYRTEFAFLKERLPDEEDLYREYVEVVRQSPGATIIRTLDVGADKLLKAQESAPEPNPALGVRGIRFTLRNQGLFRSQLRALLRAGTAGRLALLLPMICTVEEVRAVRRILQEVDEELTSRHVDHASDLPVGIMVETPAAMLVADALASECDFFSIGTNDLIHYLMAIDRNNRRVAYLNDPMHPAVIRALKRIIDMGHREGISVSACGELASDPFGVVLMLGMGIDTLSVSPTFLPGIKHLIRQLDSQACAELAGQVLQSTDIPACKHMVNELLQKTLGRELAFHNSSVMGARS